MSLINKIFGSYSDRELKKVANIKDQVLALAPSYKNMSEQQLQNQTVVFKDKLVQGATLDEILPEAFATMIEASTRVLGMTHFPVQVMGGVVLHQGRIAEMKTGEGKTLVATLPLYLNALTGKGVHLVTVNDYLAKFQSEWMGKVYRYLGLDVGLIVNGLNSAQRKQAYGCDIVYGTNNEYGFDYLRDNMEMSLDSCVQRELNFAIVDEVDSILIDEARTPLIISGPGAESSDLYAKADAFVRGLKKEVMISDDTVNDQFVREELEKNADYIIDRKAKSAVLTQSGVEKAEKFFGIDNLSSQENYDINHHINNALKAHGIMHIDEDYVIKDGEVIIVDDFTGRLMIGRRFSNGLHQAIEAKERVTINQENMTLATITFQNYFRMYHKLSGMTGTASTEATEFREIYNLDVVTIPTNKPMIRNDLNDAVYKTANGKYRAVVNTVKELHAKGQPVLVGTISVEKSEKLSRMFSREGIPHNVLNARQHAKEAEIVAQAGRLGAVTIATNMAGRGTDIMLGGNAEFMARLDMKKQGYEDEIIEQATAYNQTDDDEILKARAKLRELVQQHESEIAVEKAEVIKNGGLAIIGTERHESRRIDNQLRGRAGRQGDPGLSKFYLSLEDDLLKLFGGERMDRMFANLGVDENTEIQSGMLSKLIESAQRKVEGQNFSIRKSVLEYDNVMNQQRNIIYSQRREVLEGKDLHEYYRRIVAETADHTSGEFAPGNPYGTDYDAKVLQLRLQDVFGDLPVLQQLERGGKHLEFAELAEKVKTEALQKLEDRADTADLGSPEMLREAERIVLLHTVDKYWMEHIDAMDDLRDSIGMRGYAQHNPVTEYQREGFDMFEKMTAGIQEDSVRLIMRAQLITQNNNPKHKKTYEGRGSSGFNAGSRSQGAGGEAAAEGMSRRERRRLGADAPPAATKAQARRVHQLGRNEPCWCGSGKKYKDCHMESDRNAENAK